MFNVGDKVILNGNPFDEQIPDELEKYYDLKDTVQTVEEINTMMFDGRQLYLVTTDYLDDPINAYWLRKAEWSIDPDIEPIVLKEDFWYMLSKGGYIIPEKILTKQDDIDKLNEAIQRIESFEEALNNQGKLEEM